MIRHVVNGDVDAGTLLAALACDPGAILVNGDSLSVGPLPPFVSREQWRACRTAFWRACGVHEGPVDEPHDLVANASVLADCEAITVWVGTAVADQLLLPFVVGLAHAVAAPLDNIAVVDLGLETGSARPRWRVRGLGSLQPEEVRQRARPKRLSPAEVSELCDVWSALTAPRPEKLLVAAAREHATFPWLREALRATLDRYPEEASGLSRWDRMLLEEVAEGEMTCARAIGGAIATAVRNDDADVGGDAVLFARLKRLGDRNCALPAVTLAGDVSSDRTCTVRLTDAGTAFLRGERSFVRANGIDEWVAGVHLDAAAGALWFRRGDALVTADGGSPARKS